MREIPPNLHLGTSSFSEESWVGPFYPLCGAPHKRKNWLFAGSDEGGERAAVLYSLIESAKRSGVEPWAYMRDVLERISTHPMNRIAELMPGRLKLTSASK